MVSDGPQDPDAGTLDVSDPLAAENQPEQPQVDQTQPAQPVSQRDIISQQREEIQTKKLPQIYPKTILY